MEDVTGWYSSQIRKGVHLDDGKLNPISVEFKEWMTHRLVRVVIQIEPVAYVFEDSNNIRYPRTLVYFEKQEDFVDYLLTFEEVLLHRRELDAAAVYAPYVPLTVTPTVNNSNVQPVIFNTRYSTLNSLISVYRSGDSDSSV